MAATHNVPQRVWEQCTESDRLGRCEEQGLLLERAALLPPQERDLLRLILSGRHTYRELARLAGGVNPGSICRRVGKLKRRLRDPVVGALVRRGVTLSESYRRIGIEYFARGTALRTLARQMGLGREEVAEAVGYLRAWARLEGI